MVLRQVAIGIQVVQIHLKLVLDYLVNAATIASAPLLNYYRIL
jgi:hypothetical protein